MLGKFTDTPRNVSEEDGCPALTSWVILVDICGIEGPGVNAILMCVWNSRFIASWSAAAPAAPPIELLAQTMLSVPSASAALMRASSAGVRCISAAAGKQSQSDAAIVAPSARRRLE